MPTLCILALAGATATSRADVPRVTSDIPPVHSLVAHVMGELGQPSLVVRPGASPHGHALRPSEAAALEASDVVFWTGAVLTPWLAREIGKLAPDAVSVELMALPGTHRLALRTGATTDGHGHGHGGDDGVDAHGDDVRDGDLHEDTHSGDAHGDDIHGGDVHGDERHDGGEIVIGEAGAPSADASSHDPHGWLDPSNAMRWLDEIAAVLARLDPANAAVYRANAVEGRRELEALVIRTGERLAPVRGRNFVVFHDSFRYFEERFGINAVAALSPSDASDASPARVHDVRSTIEGLDTVCVFTEPQLDDRRARVVVSGLDVGRGVLDPLGATLEPGPDLYERLVDGLTRSLVDCLAAPTGSAGDPSSTG